MPRPSPPFAALGFVALLVAVLEVAAQAPSGPPWLGRFRIADGPAADRNVAHAIDESIAGLSPSMRDVFRSGLRSSLAVPRQLVIAQEGEDLVVTRDGRSVRAVAGGPERSQTGPEGHTVRVRHRIEGGDLVEERKSPQGVRTDTFRSRGGELVVATEYRSPLLRGPVRFEVAYRTSGAEAPAAEGPSTAADGGVDAGAPPADAGVRRGRRARPDAGARPARRRDGGTPRDDTSRAPR